jgi:hypothetical protein
MHDSGIVRLGETFGSLRGDAKEFLDGHGAFDE